MTPQTKSTLIPSMRYRNAHAAIDWLVQAFGFEKNAVYDTPEGDVAHAQLTLGAGMIMIGSVPRNSDYVRTHPSFFVQPDEVDLHETRGIYVVVSDADQVYARAKEAGAKIEGEIRDMEYGGRGFLPRPGGSPLEHRHLRPVAAGSSQSWMKLCSKTSNRLIHEATQLTWHNKVQPMELNPYASFLGGQAPIDVITSTAQKLHSFIDPLSAAEVDRPPSPGKWSIREIVAHLADCEIVFSFRLRQAIAEDHPIIQPFDQTVWGERYGAYDLSSGLALFTAARSWNVKFLTTITEDDRHRPTTHPERGTMTFWTIVETMGGHDINHLRQIERIAKTVASE
jgi:uncharacterized glyoxalase superfamily protein PhnB